MKSTILILTLMVSLSAFAGSDQWAQLNQEQKDALANQLVGENVLSVQDRYNTYQVGDYFFRMNRDMTGHYVRIRGIQTFAKYQGNMMFMPYALYLEPIVERGHRNMGYWASDTRIPNLLASIPSNQGVSVGEQYLGYWDADSAHVGRQAKFVVLDVFEGGLFLLKHLERNVVRLFYSDQVRFDLRLGQAARLCPAYLAGGG